MMSGLSLFIEESTKTILIGEGDRVLSYRPFLPCVERRRSSVTCQSQRWQCVRSRFATRAALGSWPQERRALSDDEMLRLLAGAGELKPVYLMAVNTGLRRSEMGALRWGDLVLDAVTPFVTVRASTTKNGKAVAMRLRPELAEVLRELKVTGAPDNEPVFRRIPRIERFRRDLKNAGIAFQDCQGRSADFHSLRKTFGTNLARGGCAQPGCDGADAA